MTFCFECRGKHEDKQFCPYCGTTTAKQERDRFGYLYCCGFEVCACGESPADPDVQERDHV